MRTYKTLLTILFLMKANLTFCQVDSLQSDHRIIFSLTGGIGIPLGAFAKYQNINSASSPYAVIANGAEAGFTGRLEGKYVMLKNLKSDSPLQGIGIELIYSSIANEALTVPGDSMFPFKGVPLGQSERISSYSFSTNKWHTKNFLAGFTVELGDSVITVSLKLAGGYQQIECPELSAKETGTLDDVDRGISYNFSQSYSQSNMTSKNFVFNFGADLSIHLTKQLSIIAGFDILLSKASFSGEYNYTSQATNANNSNPYHSFSFNKNISMLALNAGLSYAIN